MSLAPITPEELAVFEAKRAAALARSQQVSTTTPTLAPITEEELQAFKKRKELKDAMKEQGTIGPLPASVNPHTSNLPEKKIIGPIIAPGIWSGRDSPGLLTPSRQGEPPLLQQFASGVTGAVGRRMLEKAFDIEGSTETPPQSYGGAISRGLGTATGLAILFARGGPLLSASTAVGKAVVPSAVKTGAGALVKETLKRRALRGAVTLGAAITGSSALQGPEGKGRTGLEVATEIGGIIAGGGIGAKSALKAQFEKNIVETFNRQGGKTTIKSVARHLQKTTNLGPEEIKKEATRLVRDKIVEKISASPTSIATFKTVLGDTTHIDKIPNKSAAFLQDVVDDITTKAIKIEQDALAAGKPAKAATKMRNVFFKQSLKDSVGIKDGTLKDHGALSKIFQNQIERGDDVYRKTGINTTEVVMGLIRGENAANRLYGETLSGLTVPFKNAINTGLSSQKIYQLMHYVESAPEGFRFIRTGLKIPKVVTIPPYKGPAPTADQLKHLGALRQAFDATFQANPGYFKDVPYVSRYVPIFHQGKDKTISGVIRSFKEGVGKARKSGKITADVLDDMGRVIEIYSRMVTKSAAYNPILPKVNQASWQLRALGLDGEARNLEEMTRRLLGLKNTKQVRRAFTNIIVDSHKDTINELLKSVSIEPNIGKQIMSEVSNLMYHGWVFTNPKTLLIKQPLQNDLSGTAEIGWSNVQAGRAAYLGGKYKGILNKARDFLRSTHLNIQGLSEPPPASKAVTLIGKVLRTPSQPLAKIFDKTDVVSRESAFLGAYLQFNKGMASNRLQHVLDGLLEAEKAMVMRALKAKGPEEAGILYGAIRSQRINLAYNLADKPEWMRGELSQYIPLTTWGRNQLNRVVFGDLKGMDFSRMTKGDIKHLASRIATPLIYMHIMGAIFGVDFPADVHPLSGLPGALPGPPFPVAADVLEEYRTQGLPGAARSVGKTIPAVKMIKLMKDTEEKGLGEGFFKLKKKK